MGSASFPEFSAGTEPTRYTYDPTTRVPHVAAVARSQWPDKALFASSLVVMAGILSAVFLLVTEVASVDKTRIPEVLRDVPLASVLLLSLGSIAMGIVAMRTKRLVWAWIAGILCVASLGAFGLASVAGLVALVFLLVAVAEGEGKEPRLASNQWPDKALAASLVLAVAGLLAIWQGLAVFFGRMDPIIVKDVPAVMGAIDLALGFVAIAGAMEAFKVRHPRVVLLGALAAIVSVAGYVVGPALGLTAMVLVFAAHREREWV